MTQDQLIEVIAGAMTKAGWFMVVDRDPGISQVSVRDPRDEQYTCFRVPDVQPTGLAPR